MKKFPTLCVLAAVLLMVGCVSQKEYDASQQKNAELEAQYAQLNQTMGSEIAGREMHISRMQDAIKVSLNDTLLFPWAAEIKMRQDQHCQGSRGPGASSEKQD